MKGETYERRTVKPFEASKYAGVDFSIPDRDDHEKHLADVARAIGDLGFPVLPR